jgi:DNA-binding MarR family transcriptional regulator
MELKRTDIQALRDLQAQHPIGMWSYGVYKAVLSRLLAAGLIRWKPGSYQSWVVITKAGREALAAATTTKEA